MMTPYQKALVLGCGDSGGAAARLLRSEGTQVVVVDEGGTAALQKRAEDLQREGIEVLLEQRDWPNVDFDVCVVSPGVPLTSSWIIQARERHVPLLSELELGWIRRNCPIIAVTGSNGKSTVVKWIAESLRAGGLRVEVGGNFGPPVSRVVMERQDLDWLVLEVSTFQLETVSAFRAEIGLLLNIHPNHLDRHGDMETYRALKARLFAKAISGDASIVHEPLLEEVQRLSGGRGRWISFGHTSQAHYRYESGRVMAGDRMVLDLKGTHFENEVLGEAGAAVAAALTVCAMDPSVAAKAAASFTPLPHRMQQVGEIRGVRFINDSKATNLAAMAAALRMIPSSIRLIAGGLGKEKDLSFVKELLAQKVRGVYLIGQASRNMASAWSDVVSCFLCETLDAAVKRAADDAEPGEVVLLSPACASFDQFRNFEDRGDRFARLVQNRAEEVFEKEKKIAVTARAVGDSVKGVWER